ncbi:MAG: Uma2 family endonuclease, partial [Planctomycetes bacterium]|nr:Uma2 family endonuclease [Planctomycetota bacterium]
MEISQARRRVSPEEFLTFEESSFVSHEYLDGAIYEMAAETNKHNMITGNLSANLHSNLRGKKFKTFNSDTKLRLRLGNQIRFYYPDVSVTCQQNPPDDSFQDSPTLVVEVLSKSTRRTDMEEKKDAYLKLS